MGWLFSIIPGLFFCLSPALARGAYPLHAASLGFLASNFHLGLANGRHQKEMRGCHLLAVGPLYPQWLFPCWVAPVFSGVVTLLSAPLFRLRGIKPPACASPGTANTGGPLSPAYPFIRSSPLKLNILSISSISAGILTVTASESSPS